MVDGTDTTHILGRVLVRLDAAGPQDRAHPAGGYALAVNVQRRNLTKGQRAMLIVDAGLSTEYTDDGDGSKISKQYISRARFVSNQSVRSVRNDLAQVSTKYSPEAKPEAPAACLRCAIWPLSRSSVPAREA